MLMTTADLPEDMRYDPDNATSRAVRASGLRVVCRHGNPECARCITDAARRVIAATDTPS